MKTFIFLLSALFAILSCTMHSANNDIVTVYVDSQDAQLDSIYIRDLSTERVLTAVPVNSPKTPFTFALKQSTTGEIRIKGKENFYLTTLTKGKTLRINIDTKNTITTRQSVSDSLLNYLLSNQNQFYS